MHSSKFRTPAALLRTTLAVATLLACISFGASSNAAPATRPVHITVGYLPYYSLGWSALVVKNQQLWKKYLPPGSTVDWAAAANGTQIVDNLTGGTYQFGYVNNMPAIAATTRRTRGDIRIVGLSNFSNQQCNLFVVRSDAPHFETPQEAIRWMNGKRVAVSTGTCADMFAQEIFLRLNVKPAEYLNLGIQAIRTGLAERTVDAAVIWEPNLAYLGSVVGNKTAREVSTGADWGDYDGGEIIAGKRFIDANPAIVVAMLKAEIEAQRFIVSNYPKNACALVDYAVSEAQPGFNRRQLWYAIYGRTPSPDPSRRAIRYSAHLVFDAPVRAFFTRASQFLVAQGLVDAPMPADAIVEGPLKAAMRDLDISGPLGDASIHNNSEYPCG